MAQTDSTKVNTTSEEFAKRLAANLRVARERRRLTTKEIAARSDGMFKPSTLEALEAGRLPLAGIALAPLAQLYRLNLDTLLQPRMAVTVHPNGTLAAGAVSVGFDPADSDSLLLSYLHLVRDLRNQRRDPVVALRREDVESLAGYLKVDGALVLDRLGKLMGYTRVQRRTMAILFAAGAAVIMAATISFAVAPQPDMPQADGFDSSADAVTRDHDASNGDDGFPGFDFDGPPVGDDGLDDEQEAGEAEPEPLAAISPAPVETDAPGETRDLPPVPTNEPNNETIGERGNEPNRDGETTPPEVLDPEDPDESEIPAEEQESDEVPGDTLANNPPSNTGNNGVGIGEEEIPGQGNGNPFAPDVPESPDVPENPEAPVVPEAPEAPLAQEVPETQEAPEAPEAPEAQDVVETPEVPKVPEAPVVVETPEVAETPEDREQAEKEAKQQADAEAKAEKAAEKQAEKEAKQQAAAEAKAEKAAEKQAEKEAKQQAAAEAKAEKAAEKQAEKEAEQQAAAEAKAEKAAEKQAEKEAKQQAAADAKAEKAEQEAKDKADRAAQEKAEQEARDNPRNGDGTGSNGVGTGAKDNPGNGNSNNAGHNAANDNPAKNDAQGP